MTHFEMLKERVVEIAGEARMKIAQGELWGVLYEAESLITQGFYSKQITKEQAKELRQLALQVVEA